MRLIACLFAVLTSLAAAELDTAPLEAWLAKQGSVRTLEADFIQERTLPALRKPVSTPGTFSMQRPGKMRWELGKPVKTLAVSDGTTMTLVDVTKKRANRVGANSSRAKPFTLLADGALNGDLAGFKKTFDLVESRVTNGIYQLTARPRNPKLRDKVQWVFLDIDPKTQLLRAMEIRLDDKSSIRTIFSNSKINTKLPADRFTADLTGYSVR
ncbi:LolA family protein [Haloferula sp.]|uniref:LolA family protein n=1 Tax=Haloferula sp. TaxID=2497595 RepID=UPI00329ED7C2